MQDIEAIKKEYDEVLQQLSDPELISDEEKMEKLLKKKGGLEKIIEKIKEIENIKNEIEENKEILRAGEDQEFSTLAETTIAQLKEKEKNVEIELEILLEKKLKGNPGNENKSIIVEIRAGTGGDESALFVANLFKMYSKYSQKQGWKQKTLDSHPTELGGFKEIIFELGGENVFSKMKYEGGVHRVQRIPATEKAGRVHTSTASVAILPKPKKTEIKISPQDLRFDVYHASGHGGQYVNKRMTAIRITHLPTGTVVTCQTERSLQQNKENALAVLEARILEKRESENLEKIAGKRKAQVGWAKRAEKIRTYNFPQDRLTDHRIKKSWYDLEEIMAGKLDSIIKALEKSEKD